MKKSPKFDIHKAAGILIKDRKLLVVRGEGKDFFKSPGGKLDSGENSLQALVRELREELCVEVSPSDVEEFGTYFGTVIGNESRSLKMDVFMVKKWEGKIKLNPDDQIVELKWIDSNSVKNITLGSIFEHEVMPILLKMGLID